MKAKIDQAMNAVALLHTKAHGYLRDFGSSSDPDDWLAIKVRNIAKRMRRNIVDMDDENPEVVSSVITFSYTL